MCRVLVAVVAIGLALAGTQNGSLHAQQGGAIGVNPTASVPPPAMPPDDHFAGPWPRELLTTEQVEKLVGPIALYPDPLLAQVLPASTYPLEIVKAARLVRGGADEAAIMVSDLDASVQALARYPEVIAMMDEHLEWTERLGLAFLDQPDDVMQAVQRLRTVARDLGNLATTPQQEVVLEQETISIVPVTEYVYVPYYEPSVVYWQPCPTTYSHVGFRSCSWVGPWYDLDCDWRRRTLCRRPGWSWRHECDQRAGRRFGVDRFDRHGDRDVQDWSRDPDRRGRPGGDDRRDGDGGRDRGGGGRDRDGRRSPASQPQAAEPNPPRITGPRPPPAPPREQAPTPTTASRPPRAAAPNPPIITAPPPPPGASGPGRSSTSPAARPNRPDSGIPEARPERKPRPVAKQDSRPDANPAPVARPRAAEPGPPIIAYRPEAARPTRPDTSAGARPATPSVRPRPEAAPRREPRAAAPAPPTLTRPASPARPAPRADRPAVERGSRPEASAAARPARTERSEPAEGARGRRR